jgi:hypothetical protein
MKKYPDHAAFVRAAVPVEAKEKPKAEPVHVFNVRIPNSLWLTLLGMASYETSVHAIVVRAIEAEIERVKNGQ